MKNETIVIRIHNGGGAELLAKFQYEGDAQEFMNHWCRDSASERYGYLVRYCAFDDSCHAQLPGDNTT